MKKIRIAGLDLTFLTNSHRLNVYLKFLTFNLPNVTSNGARFIKRSLLSMQSKKEKKSYDHLERILLLMRKILQKIFFPLINTFWTIYCKNIKTHERKLKNLTKKVTLLFANTETVHDLPNVTLTTKELDLVKYDLKHRIHPLQVNKTDILTTYILIHCAMTKDLKDEKQSAEVKTKISNLAHSYVKSYKPTLHALRKHRILKRLAKNKDIVILRPDKDSGTVILSRYDLNL